MGAPVTTIAATTTPAPSRVTITGRRMNGSVPVVFYLGGRMQPVIRFGGDRYNTGESIVTVNGVDIDVAGFVVHFHRGEWVRDCGYRNMRRAGTLDDPPPGAAKTLTEALVAEATRLADKHPDAFTSPRRAAYHDADALDERVARLDRSARIMRDFATLAHLVEDGDARLEPRALFGDPPAIRWETPDRDVLNHSDPLARGRGMVVGRIVNTRDGYIVGYAVDSSEHEHRPDTYHGPALIPAQLVTD